MNGEVISFFEKFSCLADKCPANCCRAWDMPLDSETLERYKKVSGKEGLMLQLSLTHNPEGDVVLRTPFGRCCNLARNGLCKLHRDERFEYMPKVCRLYPRNTVEYGKYKYATLDLSCIGAATLFMLQSGRVQYVEAPENMEIYWKIEDVYDDFVTLLREDLDRVLDYLWSSEESLWTIERDIFAHVYGMHQLLVKDDAESAAFVPFDIEELMNLCGEEFPAILRMRTEEEEVLPFFPIGFINELIYQKIPEDYLMLYHPKVNRLIKSYKKQFGKLTESSADASFLNTYKEICEKYDWLEDKMKEYFSYKLQMNYLNAAIDYYVLEPVLLASFNVQFLMVLVITVHGAGETISKERFVELLSENEKLISHNKVFNSEIMSKLRQELF